MSYLIFIKSGSTAGPWPPVEPQKLQASWLIPRIDNSSNYMESQKLQASWSIPRIDNGSNYVESQKLQATYSVTALTNV